MTLVWGGRSATHRDKGFLDQSACCSWISLPIPSPFLVSLGRKGSLRPIRNENAFPGHLFLVRLQIKPSCWLCQGHLTSEGSQFDLGEEGAYLGCCLFLAQGFRERQVWAAFFCRVDGCKMPRRCPAPPAPGSHTSSHSPYHLVRALSVVSRALFSVYSCASWGGAGRNGSTLACRESFTVHLKKQCYLGTIPGGRAGIGRLQYNGRLVKYTKRAVNLVH